MRLLLPTTTSSADISEAALEAHYAYPASPTQPWVRVNFVASVDGSASVGGASGGLSSAADKQVFGLLRQLAEVILVGAGTARAEGYQGASEPSRWTGRPPQIAVVTSDADLDPSTALFTDTEVAPLVLTTESAPSSNRRALLDAGAEVAACAGEHVDLQWALEELDRRGMRRVLCEGGPGLFGRLLVEDLVDELCLTVGPLLTGGDAGRISHGPDHSPRQMNLVGAIEAEGVLLLRYRRDAATSN